MGTFPAIAHAPSFLQEQLNITLDHRCRIFQNLDGALGEQPPSERATGGGGEKGEEDSRVLWEVLDLHRPTRV